MESETPPSDAAGYFGSADEVLEYIRTWLEDGSPREIARALGDVARSKGLSEISPRSGCGRQALAPALARNGNPTLEAVMAVLDGLGLELSVRKKAA